MISHIRIYTVLVAASLVLAVGCSSPSSSDDSGDGSPTDEAQTDFTDPLALR